MTRTDKSRPVKKPTAGMLMVNAKRYGRNCNSRPGISSLERQDALAEPPHPQQECAAPSASQRKDEDPDEVRQPLKHRSL